MNPLSFFKCLADDTRLKCILLISQIGEACVCDLITALDLEQPKISRHLAALRKCEILLDERRGKWVYYQLHPKLPAWAKKVIQESAQHNPEYFESATKKLNASLQAKTACS